MKVCSLSFGKIVVLSKNLAEVIVNEGVVFNEVIVDEYHDFLLNTLEAPFSLIINKKHAYTYTFPAQKRIANLNEIKAMAVVVHTPAGKMSTKTLAQVNGNNNWNNIKIFQDRAEALLWIKEEMFI